MSALADAFKYELLPAGTGSFWAPGLARRTVSIESLERTLRAIRVRENILLSALAVDRVGPAIWVEWDAPELPEGGYDLGVSYRAAMKFLTLCGSKEIPAEIAFSGNKSFRVVFASAAAGVEPASTDLALVARLVDAMARRAGATGHDPALYNRRQLIRLPGCRHRSADGRQANGMSTFFEPDADFEEVVARSFDPQFRWPTKSGYPAVRLPHREWLQLETRDSPVVATSPRSSVRSTDSLRAPAGLEGEWPNLFGVADRLGLGRRFACPDPQHDSGPRCCTVLNEHFWRCFSHPNTDGSRGAYFRAPRLVGWKLGLSYGEACGWLREARRDEVAS